MKILKYLLLLCLLFLIGGIVFLATQKNTYSIKKSVYINVRKDIVFSYLNDLKNWKEWHNNLNKIKLIYSDTTFGEKANFTWYNAESDGKITISKSIKNQLIGLETEISDNHSTAHIQLKDTLKGTKLTWTATGKVGFTTKIKAFLSGGLNDFMNNLLKKDLTKLENIIEKDLSNFTINIEGMLRFPRHYYIKKSIICKPENYITEINTQLPKIKSFFKENNLKINGSPYIIKEMESKDTLKFSIYTPMFSEIFTSNGSDMTTGIQEEFSGLKATLTGDYSHLNELRLKLKTEFENKKLVPKKEFNQIELFVITENEIKKSSQWKTILMMPVYTKPKEILKPKKQKVVEEEIEPETRTL